MLIWRNQHDKDTYHLGERGPVSGHIYHRATLEIDDIDALFGHEISTRIEKCISTEPTEFDIHLEAYNQAIKDCAKIAYDWKPAPYSHELPDWEEAANSIAGNIEDLVR